MDLFLIRHAHAENAANGDNDAARPLSPKGRSRFEHVVEGLARLGIRFDLVLHSPWLRAVETAQLLMPIVRGESRVTASLAAAPGRALLAQLAGGGAPIDPRAPSIPAEKVAAVGHQPWLSELLAWLVLEDPDVADRLHMGKGAVAWLKGEPTPGGMRLHALFSAKSMASANDG